MAHFLAYAGRVVGHDAINGCATIDEFKKYLTSGRAVGSCETAGMLGWRVLRKEIPGVKIVVIRRDLGEVLASLARFGLQPDPVEMYKRAVMLDMLSHQPGVMTYPYSMLGDPEICRTIFEYCLDCPFDWDWWVRLNATNIQVNMNDKISQLIQVAPAMEAIKRELASRSVGLGSLDKWLN